MKKCDTCGRVCNDNAEPINAKDPGGLEECHCIVCYYRENRILEKYKDFLARADEFFTETENKVVLSDADDLVEFILKLHKTMNVEIVDLKEVKRYVSNLGLGL
jgi:hypothetical protein